MNLPSKRFGVAALFHFLLLIRGYELLKSTTMANIHTVILQILTIQDFLPAMHICTAGFRTCVKVNVNVTREALYLRGGDSQEKSKMMHPALKPVQQKESNTSLESSSTLTVWVGEAVTRIVFSCTSMPKN